MSAIPAPPALTGGDRSRFTGLEKPRARRAEGPQAGGWLASLGKYRNIKNRTGQAPKAVVLPLGDICSMFHI